MLFSPININILITSSVGGTLPDFLFLFCYLFKEKSERSYDKPEQSKGLDGNIGCPADHERDWPKRKVGFHAECERQHTIGEPVSMP